MREDVKAGFAKFYFEAALSSSTAQLESLFDFTGSDRVLFGTDFPYAGKEAIAAVLGQYHDFVGKNPRGGAIQVAVLRESAPRLLERYGHRWLGGGYSGWGGARRCSSELWVIPNLLIYFTGL